MNAKALRREAEKLRAKAGSNRQQADHMIQNAASYTKDGNADRAAAEEAQAAQLTNDAQVMEEQAAEQERLALNQETQARDIESQQEQLKKDFDRQMQDLESKRKELLGGSLLF